MHPSPPHQRTDREILAIAERYQTSSAESTVYRFSQSDALEFAKRLTPGTSARDVANRIETWPSARAYCFSKRSLKQFAGALLS
jgi:hypothetical protein